jgi:hypothetical protein
MQSDPFEGATIAFNDNQRHPLGGDVFEEEPLDEPPPYESVVMGTAVVSCERKDCCALIVWPKLAISLSSTPPANRCRY